MERERYESSKDALNLDSDPDPDPDPDSILSVLWHRLDRFFFDWQSLRVMALFRICVGILALLDLLCLRAPEFTVFYGPHPIVTRECVERCFFGHVPHFNLLAAFPNSSLVTPALFWGAIVSALSLSVGFKTRWSAILLWILLQSFNNQAPLILNGQDVLLSFFVLMLAFSNGGDWLSIDCLLHRRTATSTCLSGWAPRVLQLQIAFVYMASWSSKISGESWRNGTAVYYALRCSDLMHLSLPASLDALWFIRLLTWLTLSVELAIFTLIWFRPLRLPVIALGAMLHLGIDLTMNIPLFEWLFMAGLLVFLDDRDLQALRQSAQTIGRHLKTTVRFPIEESESSATAAQPAPRQESQPEPHLVVPR